ncbi:MAG: integrase core domain-containing protein [Bacteroidia bacterium]
MAERINGIIKEEYLETYEINNLKDAKRLLQFVDLYNNERPYQLHQTVFIIQK